MGSEPDRQRRLVQDFSRRQVGQRYFRRRNQPVIRGGPEQVFGEFGQLSGAIGGVVADQQGRIHLGVAEFIRMQIEHQGSQGPFHPGKRAAGDHEPGSREPGRGLEVQ